MENLFIVLFAISLIVTPVFLVVWIVLAILKKRTKAMKILFFSALACGVISLIMGIALTCEHTWIDATCEDPKTCSQCNETEGDPLGHNWNNATCLTPETCSRCETTRGTVADHNWIDATCVAPKLCGVCGLEEGKPIAHTWVEATCAAPKSCSGCDLTEGDVLPHTFTEATCDAPITCIVCSTTEGEPLGHEWNEATCQVAKTCSRCAATEGDVAPHEMGEWKTITKATCDTAGVESCSCVHCGETSERSIPVLTHESGDWEVSKKADLDKSGTKVKKCVLCGKEMETQEYELSGSEYEKAYKAACEKYKYDTIARNPDKYKGKKAKFTGEVIQVQQSDFLGLTYYVLRVDVTKGKYYYEDTVYVTYFASEDDERILEDDIITMYGELTGEETYTTIFGASVTIPSFAAEYITIK